MTFSNDVRIYDKVNHRFVTDPLSWELGELQKSGIIVCHYTGLHDYNGAKIYEYDIVQSYYSDGSIRSTYYIKYSGGKFNIDNNAIKSRHILVKGNVFTHINMLPIKFNTQLKEELGIK